jgi:tetratricopeptide (TPR) repeat protein
MSGFQALRRIGEANQSSFILRAVDGLQGYLSCDLNQCDQARKIFENGLSAIDEQTGDETWKKNSRSLYMLRLGWVDLKQGKFEAARARAAEVEKLISGSEGDIEFQRANLLLRVLLAELALAKDDPRTALSEAGKIVLWDYPGMSTTELIPYNIPLQIDVAARAHWKLGNLDKAAAEYKQLMTVTADNKYRRLIHPLYHYRLGRVLEEKSDKPGAAAEYRRFLELFKDADKIFPEPADARKRLAAL